MKPRRSLMGLAVASLALSACSVSVHASSGQGTGDFAASSVPVTERPSAAATERPSASPSAGAGRLNAAQLQGRWWTWAASSVTDSNPVSDPDGHLCAQGQPADVWFLAGTFGGKAERTCTVPAGVPIAFPLVNRLGDVGECRTFMGSAQGGATLDGRAVEPERYEATTVSVTAVEGNPLVDGGGTFRTYACGLWAQIAPLAPGDHRLLIRGSSGSFSVSVDYRLRVSAT